MTGRGGRCAFPVRGSADQLRAETRFQSEKKRATFCQRVDTEISALTSQRNFEQHEDENEELSQAESRLPEITPESIYCPSTAPFPFASRYAVDLTPS